MKELISKLKREYRYFKYGMLWKFKQWLKTRTK